MQADERRDAGLQQPVDQPVVEARPAGLAGPDPCGWIRDQDSDIRWAVDPEIREQRRGPVPSGGNDRRRRRRCCRRRSDREPRRRRPRSTVCGRRALRRPRSDRPMWPRRARNRPAARSCWVRRVGQPPRMAHGRAGPRRGRPARPTTPRWSAPRCAPAEKCRRPSRFGGPRVGRMRPDLGLASRHCRPGPARRWWPTRRRWPGYPGACPTTSTVYGRVRESPRSDRGCRRCPPP